MFRTRYVIRCTTLLFVVMSAGAPASAQNGYAITDLNSWGNSSYYSAYALNDLGQVVGRQDNETGESRAVVWLPEPDLGLPAGRSELGALGSDTESCALDINNAGQIVGFSEYAVRRPFIWQGGVMTELETPPEVGDYARASAINELGQVAGYMGLGWVDELLLWLPEAAYGLPAGLNNLTDEPSSGGQVCNAADINASGEIVGCQKSDMPPFCYGRLWLPAGAYGLSAGFKNIYPLTFVRGINDMGQAVGSGDPEFHDVIHACLWQMGTVTDLGTLGGDWSSASGIDNSGVIVGRSQDVGGAERAFLWDEGDMVDLNDLISPASGWILDEAIDLNEAGQILVRGTVGRDRRYGLLTPAVCGDGNVEGIEQCDDENTVPGDGCDENCRIEPPIPTVTAWGAAVMLLLLLAAGTIINRRHGAAAPRSLS